MKLEYYSNVIEGRLQKNVAASIAEDLKKFEGKRICLTIGRLKSTRSNAQNKYWWTLMNILSKELGYTKDEIHEICKYKFLKLEKVDPASGEIFEYLGSTTKLNKTEFADMVNELIRWSAETFDIVLPLPNEQTELL